jgi:hypothetical protein
VLKILQKEIWGLLQVLVIEILWCKSGAFETKENRQAIDNQSFADF